MNLDYLNIVKNRLESECAICSNKLFISFIITIIVIYFYNGFKFNNIMDMVVPVVIYGVIYVIVNEFGRSLITKEKFQEEYDDVKETFQNYMDDLNHEIFEQMKEDNKPEEEKNSTLPPLPTKVPHQDVPNKDEKNNKLMHQYKEDKEMFLVEHLDNSYASADIQSGDIGCMLDPKMCSQLCSGKPKPSYLVAPIPGPQWQPQSAESIQNRIANGNYVPANCMD